MVKVGVPIRRSAFLAVKHGQYQTASWLCGMTSSPPLHFPVPLEWEDPETGLSIGAAACLYPNRNFLSALRKFRPDSLLKTAMKPLSSRAIKSVGVMVEPGSSMVHVLCHLSLVEPLAFLIQLSLSSPSPSPSLLPFSEVRDKAKRRPIDTCPLEMRPLLDPTIRPLYTSISRAHDPSLSLSASYEKILLSSESFPLHAHLSSDGFSLYPALYAILTANVPLLISLHDSLLQASLKNQNTFQDILNSSSPSQHMSLTVEGKERSDKELRSVLAHALLRPKGVKPHQSAVVWAYQMIKFNVPKSEALSSFLHSNSLSMTPQEEEVDKRLTFIKSYYRGDEANLSILSPPFVSWLGSRQTKGKKEEEDVDSETAVDLTFGPFLGAKDEDGDWEKEFYSLFRERLATIPFLSTSRLPQLSQSPSLRPLETLCCLPKMIENGEKEVEWKRVVSRACLFAQEMQAKGSLSLSPIQAVIIRLFVVSFYFLSLSSSLSFLQIFTLFPTIGHSFMQLIKPFPPDSPRSLPLVSLLLSSSLPISLFSPLSNFSPFQECRGSNGESSRLFE